MAPSMPGDGVAVLLPLPFDEAFEYRSPENLALAPGDFVSVPFGGRMLVGVVWGPAEGRAPTGSLKDVDARLPVAPLPEVSRTFIAWVARYTVSPLGSVLRMAMSVPLGLSPAPDPPRYRLAPSPAEPEGSDVAEPEARWPEVRWNPKRRQVIAALGPETALSASELALAAGVGRSVVKGLIEAGVLVAADAPPPALPSAPAPLALSEPQRAAGEALRAATGDGFSVTLLDGVAGSGKTEVYFEAIDEALARGRQVLVLIPEIALTAQWLARFEARFGRKPGLWHSNLTQQQRVRTWRAIAEGSPSAVVGARSALFLPFPALGLIIVDEEHDEAFKQEDGVAYHARDMAVVRAQLGGIPAVLVSATPALETIANVRAGKYAKVSLPARFGAAPAPDCRTIDLRSDAPSPGSCLAPPLVAAMAATLRRGQQVLLFLNRRGYTPLTLCRACGYRFLCKNCSAWLVDHRLTGTLDCHHCGYRLRRPAQCPACAAEGSLTGCGPGVERVAEEVEALFPQARSAIATSDTLPSARATHAFVRQMEERQIDIVIGTQILAKGLHFPDLTLVGVIDADLGLGGGDLRASERTFQLLMQVAGRSGRGAQAGQVLLQTFMPEHPVIRALVGGDRDRFIETELAIRRAAGMPPYGRLAALIVSGSREAAVIDGAAALARAAPRVRGIRVLGPTPAAMALLRGKFRWRLLVKGEKQAPLSAYVRQWVETVKLSSGLRLQVNVDPYAFG